MWDNDRAAMRNIEIQNIKRRKDRHKTCPHMEGQNSYQPPYWAKYAFHMLKLPTGEIIGVCPYCQKTISSIDPSDNYYFESGNLKFRYMPESGQYFENENQEDRLFRQLARQTPEEKERIIKETIALLRDKPKPITPVYPRQGTWTDEELRAMPFTQLEELAQAEYIRLRKIHKG